MGPVHFLRRTKGGGRSLYCSSLLPPRWMSSFSPNPFPVASKRRRNVSYIHYSSFRDSRVQQPAEKISRSERGRGRSANLTPGHQDSWRAKGSLTVAFLVLGPYRVKNAPQSCLPRSARHCLPSIWRRKRMEGKGKRIKHPQGEMGENEDGG